MSARDPFRSSITRVGMEHAERLPDVDPTEVDLHEAERIVSRFAEAPMTMSSVDPRRHPTLTRTQIAQFAKHGRERPVAEGEILFDRGQRAAPMFAFLIRRAALISRGQGDVVLVGSAQSLGTLRLQEFLSRNGHPYSYLDGDADAAAKAKRTVRE